jgi:serine phosphatase RsbU (regulator of sigma subunit)
MTTARSTDFDVGRLLAAVEDAAPVAAADVVGAALADHLGATHVAFLIADFSGDALIRLGHGDGDGASRTHGSETAETVPLAGSPHGHAVTSQTIHVRQEGDRFHVLAPVSNRGEALGVLELMLPGAPDEAALADLRVAARALAFAVVANRRFTDLFEWGQRSVPLSLAAEIQHRLLPGTYTCEAGEFTLAGWLEPAGDIAGDTFDFSVDRGTLHLSMTDAMGHGVEAALLATVLVGALRNARRAGVGLAEQADRANAELARQVQQSQFVTGQIVRVDLERGTAAIVNAGHPGPLRLRDGRVEHVELEPDVPFGTSPEHRYEVQPLPLEPGDRLVFLTDGLLERNAADVDLAPHVLDTAGMHPRQAVQHLNRVVLEATGGTLQDDATILMLDWHGAAAVAP